MAARDPASATTLVSAYEMRARARFGTGNRDGAITDFKAALAIDPGFTLAEGVSPRIVALLDEVKASTLGAMELTLDPPAADVVDRWRPAEAVRHAAGDDRRLAHDCASRAGYKPIEQSVLVNVGETVPLTHHPRARVERGQHHHVAARH